MQYGDNGVVQGLGFGCRHLGSERALGSVCGCGEKENDYGKGLFDLKIQIGRVAHLMIFTLLLEPCSFGTLN